MSVNRKARRCDRVLVDVQPAEQLDRRGGRPVHGPEPLEGGAGRELELGAVDVTVQLAGLAGRIRARAAS